MKRNHLYLEMEATETKCDWCFGQRLFAHACWIGCENLPVAKTSANWSGVAVMLLLLQLQRLQKKKQMKRNDDGKMSLECGGDDGFWRDGGGKDLLLPSMLQRCQSELQMRGQ